jgi:hypothetical protein
MAADDDSAPGRPARDEDGRSWRGLYALVLAGLVVTVVLLTLLTWAYR